MKKQKQCKWFPVCPMKYFLEQGKLDRYWVDMYCQDNWKECIRYQKEEAGIYHPDNMMPNGIINNNL